MSFGSQKPGGLFGSTPSGTGFSFGGTQGTTTGFSFGSPATTQPTPATSTATPTFGNATKPAFSFGAAANTQAPNNTTFGASTLATQASGTGLFSNVGTSSISQPSGLFGATSQPSTVGFGTKATAAPTATSGAPFGFPSSTGQPTSAPLAFAGFGTPSAAVPTVTTQPSATQPSTFSFAPSSIAGTSAATTAAPATTTIAPTNLFATPSKPGGTGISTGIPATTPGPLKLGDLGTPTGPATTAPSLFGKTTSTTTAPAGQTTPSTTAATPATTGVQPSANIATGISALKNRTMEEILNRWNQQLDQYTREFHRQAVEVQKWDRVILENSYGITQLCEQLNKAESLQKEIDDNLAYIDSQQTSLDNTLNHYQDELQKIIQNENMSLQSRHTLADEERENAYSLAENLNTQLDEMAAQLSVLIEEINASKGVHDRAVTGVQNGEGNGGAEVEENPVAAIVRILNEHLSSLEWLDNSTTDLAQKVHDLARVSDETRGNADRVHRAGVASGFGTPGKASIGTMFGL